MGLFKAVKNNKLRFAFTVIILLLSAFVVSLGVLIYEINQDNFVVPQAGEVSDVSVPLSDLITKEALINQTTTIDIPNATLSANQKISSFISFADGKLKIEPKKWDNGEYFIKFNVNSIPTIYSIKVKNSTVDFGALKQELIDYLNKKNLLNNYGIFLRDLSRDATININGEVDFPPASMAKMTMAILIMRDIDAGKYTLDTTYPIQDSVKFSPDDDLGKLPDGTEVPIHTYLEKLIEDSNNTAWYHMDKFLGGSYEVVNPRTVDELSVNPLFLNPHEGTANGLGKLFDDLYNARTVTPASRDYLINLMENAQEWNREGIGLGLPDGIQFANKIGNLWTDKDVNFCDSAIVYAKNTDYILIIMDKDIDWESGKQNLKDLSSIVYSYIDK